jgi:hypothetical protein
MAPVDEAQRAIPPVMRHGNFSPRAGSVIAAEMPRDATAAGVKPGARRLEWAYAPGGRVRVRLLSLAGFGALFDFDNASSWHYARCVASRVEPAAMSMPRVSRSIVAPMTKVIAAIPIGYHRP